MRIEVGRLKRRSEFLRVAAARRNWATPGLVLQARRRAAGPSESPALRVGYTASRKVGNAVERNRARRRLRAIVERVLAERAEPGYDFVVIARHGTLTRPFAALIDDMEAALRRLGAVRTGSAAGNDPATGREEREQTR